ncbi:hypothetical protein BLNAU_9442 [Blattamonas nauphoetae]|uniref:Uncharacterized protein n=1 Tax=Blattamonas nauphoetae TaxID=2049346 RepID=A0ABQ9XVT3_9EUKA|nr:hypothetical protein BLNAU_9442 [Blattamonas nauphoetae]
MRIGVQKGASRQRHIQPVLPHHSPLSDHSNPNQVHSFVGLVSSNGKKRVCGGVSVPASTVAFRELTRTSPNANCSAKLTSNTDYTKSNQTTCALFKLSSTLVARVSRFANHHSLHLHCKHSIHPHSRHVSQHSIHVCQFSTKMELIASQTVFNEENCASLAPSSHSCPPANRIAAHRFSTASNSAHPNRHLSQTLRTLARRSPCTTLSGVWISVIRKAKDACWIAGRAK